MNKIDKNELYRNLSEFLKAKGVLLQDGSYARAIEKSCEILADTINMSQQAMERAKSEIEQRLDKVRETIHRKTASGKKPPVHPRPDEPAGTKPNSKPPSSKPRRRAPEERPANQKKQTRPRKPRE
jgi:pyoverdine/dityrosine biosynthesis protein Dit1